MRNLPAAEPEPVKPSVLCASFSTPQETACYEPTVGGGFRPPSGGCGPIPALVLMHSECQTGNLCKSIACLSLSGHLRQSPYDETAKRCTLLQSFCVRRPSRFMALGCH